MPFDLIKARRAAKDKYRLSGMRPFAAVSTEDCRQLLLDYRQIVEEWERSLYMVKDAEARYNKTWRSCEAQKAAAKKWLEWTIDYSDTLDKLISRLAKAVRQTGDEEARALWLIIDRVTTSKMAIMFDRDEGSFRKLVERALERMQAWLTDN